MFLVKKIRFNESPPLGFTFCFVMFGPNSTRSGLLLIITGVIKTPISRVKKL